MFGKAIPIFRFMGFEFSLDPSWFILAFLIAWSLGAGVFPDHYRGLAASAYWWMAVAGTLGLFFSIVLHEFCHSLVARRYGMRIEGITLFIFGGVSRTEGEPPGPGAEFFMAAAGPASSVLIGFVFYLVRLAAAGPEWRPVSGVASYLAYLNWLLAGFNLLPGYPLDGGRILRAALWRARGRIKWATRIASRVGVVLGFGLMALGAVQAFTVNVIGGLWWLFIGIFLQNTARASYQQLLAVQVLGHEPVRNLMNPEPVTVPAGLTIGDLVENFIYKYHFKMYPVVDRGRLVGCVTTRQVGGVSRDRWSRTTVNDIATDCAAGTTVQPDTGALQALSLMNRTGQSRLVVMDQDRLAGVLTLKDIMKFLALKLELNEEEG